uniref:Uncharacterized protein n=1 Tax=Zea mays TaxID=4577 RepID=A0A804NYB8_MAIZE
MTRLTGPTNRRGSGTARRVLAWRRHRGRRSEAERRRGCLSSAASSSRPPAASPPPCCWVPTRASGRRWSAGARTCERRGGPSSCTTHFAADAATRAAFTAALVDAARADLNVCCTWAFNDGGYRALQLKHFSYDEEVFYVRARRDSVASAALVW